jgi:hypothetical protein
MNDEEICKEIAKYWISLGGDAEGFLYCINKIHNAILYEIKENEINSNR